MAPLRVARARAVLHHALVVRLAEKVCVQFGMTVVLDPLQRERLQVHHAEVLQIRQEAPTLLLDAKTELRTLQCLPSVGVARTLSLSPTRCPLASKTFGNTLYHATACWIRAASGIGGGWRIIAVIRTWSRRGACPPARICDPLCGVERWVHLLKHKLCRSQQATAFALPTQLPRVKAA
jgi:hypothetical protein